MFKRMFTLLALAMALFGTQCWAAAKTASDPATAAMPEGSVCVVEAECIEHTFTTAQGNNTFTYLFGTDGSLTVTFKVILQTFTLAVTVHRTTDPPGPSLDTAVFPNTTCFHYQTPTICTQYDFSGNAGGPNSDPQQGVDYRGAIHLSLTYETVDSYLDQNPAFGHAPGSSTTFSQDILTDFYDVNRVAKGGTTTTANLNRGKERSRHASRRQQTIAQAERTYAWKSRQLLLKLPEDPTMDGDTPGLSSVIALKEALEESNNFCFVSPLPGQTFHVGDEIEVAFRLTPAGTPCTTNAGNSLRDKDARMSVAKIVVGQSPAFQRLENGEGGNHFHFDHKAGLNERDLDTEELTFGTYDIMVRSDEFSPRGVRIFLIAAPPDPH